MEKQEALKFLRVRKLDGFVDVCPVCKRETLVIVQWVTCESHQCLTCGYYKLVGFE